MRPAQDLSRVDLNLLVLFEALYLEQHVGRAATRLNLSPSAVSHGLGRLRRLLDDPLFLKHPKGMVPTRRGQELSAPIADLLERVRSLVSSVEPFDPGRSRRRFSLGAPDGILAVVLPPLLSRTAACAPGVDVSAQLLMPMDIPAALDAGTVELALTPLEALPARFVMRALLEDEWAIAMRTGHPLEGRLNLDAYCGAEHLVVSLRGDPQANIDVALEAIGRRRRVAVTVPNLLLALQLAGESDLLVAAPRRLIATHAPRYGLGFAPPPLRLERFRISAVAPAVALADPGVAWLLETLEEVWRSAESA